MPKSTPQQMELIHKIKKLRNEMQKAADNDGFWAMGLGSYIKQLNDILKPKKEEVGK